MYIFGSTKINISGTEWVKHGLLEFWPPIMDESFECLLHNTYQLDIKKWSIWTSIEVYKINIIII